jgi:hypothetical protein
LPEGEDVSQVQTDISWEVEVSPWPVITFLLLDRPVFSLLDVGTIKMLQLEVMMLGTSESFVLLIFISVFGYVWPQLFSCVYISDWLRFNRE